MPDDYDKLKNDLSKKFGKIEAAIEEIVRVGVEIPSPVADALNLAKSQYEVAEKKFSQGNIKEATEEMQEAVNSADTVSDELQRFYLSANFKEACRVQALFKGHEDLADKYIPNFGKHSIDLDEIAGFMESYKSSGEKPPMDKIPRYVFQLQLFLKDFEKGEKALSAAIKKAKHANRFKLINMIAIVVATIVGAVIGSFLTHLLCRPTQPEPTASEAELQSATNNSAPSP